MADDVVYEYAPHLPRERVVILRGEDSGYRWALVYGDRVLRTSGEFYDPHDPLEAFKRAQTDADDHRAYLTAIVSRARNLKF